MTGLSEIKTESFFQSPVKTVLLAGFVAGTLDILAAIIVYGFIVANVSAVQILQSVASGVFGKASYTGGATTAILGLFFHFIIAFSWTIAYFFVFPYIGLMRKQKILSGLLYGVLVWLGMNLIVLPLSRASQGAFRLSSVLTGVVILMICIGLPVSLIVSKHYEAKSRNLA